MSTSSDVVISQPSNSSKASSAASTALASLRPSGDSTISSFPRRSKRGSYDQLGSNLAQDGGPSQPLRSLSNGQNGIFDLRDRPPGARSSGGFLLEPLSPMPKNIHPSFESSTVSSNPVSSTRADESRVYAEVGLFSEQRAGGRTFGNGTHTNNGLQTSAGRTVKDSPSFVKEGKGKNRAPRSSSDTIGNPEAHYYQDNRSPPMPALDPNLIVQMALSLSESRRMSLGPGHLVPNRALNTGRSVSAGIGRSSLTLQGGFNASGGSLRRRSQQHQYGVNTVTPQTAHLAGHRLSTATPSSTSSRLEDPSAGQSLETNYEQGFSLATWLRAEKARAFFELSHEYKRLLQFLPPLKPSSSASAQLQLGRPYNPLQYIRNRQVRARERQLLDAEAAGWDNVEAVRSWIDKVEADGQEVDSRFGDTIILPSWRQGNRTMAMQSSPPQTAVTNVTDSALTNVRRKWTKLDWSTSPASLLADAYWLEQGRNKTLIESRHGDRLFNKFHPPPVSSQSGEYDRKSYEALSRLQTQNEGSLDLTLGFQMSGLPRTHPTEEVVQSKVKSPPTSPKRSKTARVKRHLLRRRRREPEISSDSEDSNQEWSRIDGFRRRESLKYDNTRPLEKHMNRVLEAEARNDTNESLRKPSPNAKRDSHVRRGGVSAEHPNDDGDERSPEMLSPSDMDSPRDSFETDHPETPRISIEDVDAVPATLFTSVSNGTDDQAPEGELDDAVFTKKSRPSPLNFLRKGGRSKKQNRIAETDFALLNESEHVQKSPRPSFDSASRSVSYRSFNFLPSRRESHSKSHDDDLGTQSGQDGPPSTTTRFFKGGRIGEIVRSERPRVGDFVWKKQPPRRSSSGSSKQGNTSDSDTDGGEHALMLSPHGQRKIRSTDDLGRATYHPKKLPTFRSANVIEASKNSDSTSTNFSDGDHISRQSKAQSVKKSRSRFGRLAPLSVDTGDSSRRSSSLNLSRRGTRDLKSRFKDRSDRDRSPGDTRSSSRSQTRIRTANYLDAHLREPSRVGNIDGLPVTGLSGTDARHRSHARPGAGHHHWSIADGAVTPDSDTDAAVQLKDIAYVRSLLLASGVKATALVRRANEVRDPPTDFLIQAATISNAGLAPVIRREEHVVAARMLSGSLEETVAAFEEAAERFRGETCPNIHSRVDDLREKVGSRLTPLVRSCADDADAFIARLTTTHTLAIKQVNDSVDLMLRSRRRRLRWLRKAGFAMLEWVLVGLMWFIWLAVWFLKAIRTVVMGLVRGARWML